MIKKITKFQTDDGEAFETEGEAVDHAKRCLVNKNLEDLIANYNKSSKRDNLDFDATMTFIFTNAKEIYENLDTILKK